MVKFIDDDEGYLRWIDKNPHGFVINTSRNPEYGYLKLHRATCGTIKTPKRTNWTTTGYIKICSLDLEELRTEYEDWIRRKNVDRRLNPCYICKPTVYKKIIDDNWGNDTSTNEIILAEAYLHFKQFEPEDKDIQELKIFINDASYQIANKIYPKKVEIKIKTEKGSFKIWVIVIGGSVITFISTYGSFRGGIDHLVKDARNFSDMIISKIIERIDPEQEQIIRTEKRLGVPGELHRIINEIEEIYKYTEYLKNANNIKYEELGMAGLNIEIDRIEREIIKLSKHFKGKDREYIFNKLFGILREIELINIQRRHDNYLNHPSFFLKNKNPLSRSLSFLDDNLLPINRLSDYEKSVNREEKNDKNQQNSKSEKE